MGGAHAHEDPLAFQFFPPSNNNSITSLLNFPGGGGSGIAHLSSSQPGGVSMQQAWSHPRGNPPLGGRPASDAGGGMSKEEMALRKKKDRAQTTTLWARLEVLAPKVDSPAPNPHPVTASPAPAAQPLGRCPAPAAHFRTLLLPDGHQGSKGVDETQTVSIDLPNLASQPKPLVPEPYTLHLKSYTPNLAPYTPHLKP